MREPGSPADAPVPAGPGAFGILAMALVSLAFFGNSYVYDSIGPVAEILTRTVGFSDTQVGVLNAIYSAPNIVLVVFGGLLVDRFGAAKVMTATAAVCLAGAGLTAASSWFPSMAAGRFLFGIGAETFNIATTVAAINWYPTRHTALMLGVTLGFGRLGSFSADMSPSWASALYAGGWQPPLLLAAAIALSSLLLAMAYQWLDRRYRPAGPRSHAPSHPFSLRDVRGFGSRFWYLLGLCVLWYATILAFRSTFSIKYFQEAHGLSLADAGAINSYVFLAALFTTPFFGWVCDRTGRYAGMLAFGAMLLPISLGIMLGTTHLGVATVLIGVSYSLVPAAMWPLASRLVEPRLVGTAIGLMYAFQNAGIAGANVAAGRLNDTFGASAAHPGGYLPMMVLFISFGVAGSALAARLWARTGRAPSATA
jgi:MFS family permease